MLERIYLYARAIRVTQWTKNAFVLMAWFFSVADSSQTTLIRGWKSFLLALAMAGSFSLVSSAFYLLNDVSDYEADRLHPVKSKRPVAAGLIHRMHAVRIALILFAIGFAYPAIIIMILPSRTVAFGSILAYTVMQCLYTGFLKKIPFLDVATLALGFVLRAIAGAAIIDAYISPWLLTCTFFLAMFLALCKRKHERERLSNTREVLKKYHPKLLAFSIFLTGAMSVAEYTIYTFTSSMGRRVPLLWLTSFFVLFGIIRYLFLAWHKDGNTDCPERILLSDKLLWLILFGYALTSVITVALR